MDGRDTGRRWWLVWLLAMAGWWYSAAWSSLVAAGPGPDADSGQRPGGAAKPAVGAATDASLDALVRSGLVQWVRFEGPDGAQVELASNAGVVSLTVPAKVALAVGPQYRLRLSGVAVAGRPVTLYPTVRLLGYLNAPPQVASAQYPIPVPFLPDDIRRAWRGQLVRNVVYLEEAQRAIPRLYRPPERPVTDLRAGEEVLKAASAMGRPMALIQVGNRVPVEGAFEQPWGDPPVFLGPDAAGANRTTEPVEPPGLLGRAAYGWPAGRWGGLAGPARPGRAAGRLPLKVHPRMPLDEYVCDGGDEFPWAHRTVHGTVGGLEAGEAVGQFQAAGKRLQTVPANRVCIYAPRFGLARSIWLVAGATRVRGPGRVAHLLRRGAVEGRTGAGTRTQRYRSLALRQRQGPTAVAVNDSLAGLDEVRVLAAHYQQQHLEQGEGRLVTAGLGQAQEARLATAIRAARVWSRRQFPAYTALKQSGAQVSGQVGTEALDQFTERYRQPGQLVLQKTASKRVAGPGETIDFAIHYRNVGERPVNSVSIIDSLPARLEYVPGSAKTDRRAVFRAWANDVGSQQLRWDLAEPVAAGQAGVVWFQAKVR